MLRDRCLLRGARADPNAADRPRTDFSLGPRLPAAGAREEVHRRRREHEHVPLRETRSAFPPPEQTPQSAGHGGLVAPGGPDEERTHDVRGEATGDRLFGRLLLVVTRCHGTRLGEVLAAAPGV
jgi:hypothetical protein